MTRRFPALYMPDGGIDEDFPHVVNTVDSLIALGAIRPVIVVGSGAVVDSAPPRLAAMLRSAHPRSLVWQYVPRPDLTHATIFRGVGPTALARALR